MAIQAIVDTASARAMLQMPMNTLKITQWESLIERRISREVKTRKAAEALRMRKDRLDKHAIYEVLTALVPDPEALLVQALGIHISWYGQVADAEANFKLRLRPEHVIVGGEDGHAVVFASMDAACRARLLAFDGATETYDRLCRWRSNRYKSLQLDRDEFVEEEANMDLLVSALPYTNRTIGRSNPSEIIERAFDVRLGGYERLANIRRETQGGLELFQKQLRQARRSNKIIKLH